MAVLEGLQAIAQAFINQGLAANIWKREPKVSFLAALAGEHGKGPQGLDIGRPSGANVFRGLKMTKAERLTLSGISHVAPRFAFANPTNVTILGSKDTAAQLPSWTASGGTQGDMWGTAGINWTGLMDEEILIPREHYNRAMRNTSDDGRALARERLVKDAIGMGRQNMITKLASELQTGAPSDQDADPMDHLIGWNTWFSATNYCAGVDRSVAKNAQWRALVDSTAYPIKASVLIDAANIDNELQDLTEDGVVALFVNNKCFKVMKQELIDAGWVMISTVLPDMAQGGVRNIMALQKDNCYVIKDRSVPANTAYAITPSTWAFITHPDYTFSVDPFIELWKYKRGGEQALMSHVNLRGMLVCWNPGLNIMFSGITDPT